MRTKQRRLRTGLMVAAIACGAVTSALWIHSYWRIDGFLLRFDAHSFFAIESHQGLVSLTKSWWASPSRWQTGFFSLPGSAMADAVERARACGIPMDMPERSKVGMKTTRIRTHGREVDSTSLTFPDWGLLAILVFAWVADWAIRRILRKRSANPPAT